jgi:curli biogenesis system outer membrane secretion channel CsgG
MRSYLMFLSILILPVMLFPQAAPSTESKPAQAATTKKKKVQTPAEKVLSMVKSGLSEDLILKAIARENLKADLSSDEMVGLKTAGASDRIISAILDPSTVNAAAPVPPAPAAAPTAPPVVSTPPPVTPDPKSQQRRAVIDEFEWATVKTSSSEIFQTNVDIGKGIRALLVKRLQEAGKIRIVERAKIQTVMNEQDFGASNRVKKGTNAKIGRILGADVYLMGDIVAFGRDDRDKRVGLGGITNKFGGLLGKVKVGKKEDKAVVVLDYRLVDAETSEVIDTGEARGESVRKSKGLGGLFGVSNTAVGGSVDMTSSNFSETIIGEATIDACNKLAEIMNSKVPTLPKKQIDVEARVADVSGPVVTLAAGSNDGVAVGDRFEVFRIISDIKDPVTGEVLDTQVEKTGDLVITSVRERISSGQYSGTPITSKAGLARKRSQ